MNAGYGDNDYYMNATGLQSTADDFGGWLGMCKVCGCSRNALTDARSVRVEPRQNTALLALVRIPALLLDCQFAVQLCDRRSGSGTDLRG